MCMYIMYMSVAEIPPTGEREALPVGHRQGARGPSQLDPSGLVII